jgi:hypothetical protein
MMRRKKFAIANIYPSTDLLRTIGQEPTFEL